MIQILMLLGGIMVAPQNEAAGLVRLLPAELQGYRAQGKDEFFNRDNLFSLINGGAEVYRALNVQTVISRRYAQAAAPDILVDLFDMGSSADAFGAFHHDVREAAGAQVGHESEYQGGVLHFWKDRYFVSVVTLQENEQSRKAVLGIGQAIDRVIAQKGKKPDLLACLPAGWLQSHLHYFHGATLLDRHLDLGDSNPLGLSNETAGILTRYGSSKPAESELSLLLVRYRSELLAEKIYIGLGHGLLAGRDKDGMVERGKSRWSGAKRLGRDLILVLNATSAPAGLIKLEQAKSLCPGARP